MEDARRNRKPVDCVVDLQYFEVKISINFVVVSGFVDHGCKVLCSDCLLLEIDACTAYQNEQTSCGYKLTDHNIRLCSLNRTWKERFFGAVVFCRRRKSVSKCTINITSD